MLECIIVGVGGFIGTVCRYLVGLISFKEGCAFPVKTWLINIIGSFLIGMIAALAVKIDSLNPRIVLFLKIGICGGFTTFSSFALETSDLLKEGRMHLAALYVILSMVVGILAVWAGQEIIRRV